jgi:Fic family protein
MIYVPPPPEIVSELMAELVSFTNQAPSRIDPIIAGALSAFGFVFIHRFMDGNGRLSRFLFHYALCQSGQLAKGLLLPVSIAMKRREDAYLRGSWSATTGSSKPSTPGSICAAATCPRWC